MKNKGKISLWPALFIGPHMLLFVLFFLIPAMIGIYVSMTEWDLYSQPVFVGLDNFRTLLWDTDSIYHTQFINGFKNTMLFALLSVPLCIVIPLGLAAALSAKPRLARFFQSILYLPTLFAISAVMIIWGFLLSLSFGPIKELFGFDVHLTGTQPWAWLAIVAVTIWWTAGGNLIIYTAALSNVSRELLEAAELDGANNVTKFFKISLPSIKNQLLFTTVMTTIAVFVGLDNFRTLLWDTDSIYHTQFINGFKNTMLFALLSVPLCIVIPLGLAAALSAKPRLARFFQSILYLPTLFAISAVMIIWGFLLSLSFGPIKELFGFDVHLTGTQPWAWLAIVAVTIWWTAGGNLIIYTAALSNVSRELLEAAELDGANNVTKFFKISLPSIKNQLLFTTVMTTIAQFNIYGQPLMLTGGGPNNSTRVLMMYIQENAFGSSTSVAGMSSAMAVLLGLAIMIVSIFQFVSMKKLEK